MNSLKKEINEVFADCHKRQLQNQVVKLIAKHDPIQKLFTKYLGESFADANHWITTESGSHALLDGQGNIVGGMGGKFTGKNIKDIHGTKKFTKHETNKETDVRHKKEAKQSVKTTKNTDKLKSLQGIKSQNKRYDVIRTMSNSDLADIYNEVTGKNSELPDKFLDKDELSKATPEQLSNEGSARQLAARMREHLTDHFSQSEQQPTPEPEQAKQPAQVASEPEHAYSGLNNVANRYRVSVNENGEISTEKGLTGLTVKVKKGRVRVENKSGDLLYSGVGDDAMGKFIEKFWDRKPTQSESQ